jgi:hypothetical protein
MQTVLRQNKAIIYRLERNYGLSVYLRQPIENVNDVETGAIQRSFLVTKLYKVPVLPGTLIRDFAYDLTYLAANKNFAYGAFFDRTIAFFIINKRYVSQSITLSDHIIHNQRRYDIISVELAEDNKAYLIKAKMLESSDLVEDPYASE